MGLTVEQVQKAKDFGWNVAKTVLKSLAYVGGGILVSTACAGVDTKGLGKVAKIATGVGMVGLAGAAGKVASKQLEEYVDDAREVAEVGEEVVDNLDEIREQLKAGLNTKDSKTAEVV